MKTLRNGLLAAAVLLLAAGSTAASLLAVSDRDALQAALAAAKAGDVIVLADGEYGNVTIDRNYSGYVTIESANPLGAKFDSIEVNNSSYLKFDGVHVDAPTNGGPAGVLLGISGSDHIMVVNSEVNGKVDSVYPINGYFGIRTQDSSYVTITNNDVHDVLNGIANGSVDHLVVSENFVDRVGSDYFKFGDVHDALVENNTGGGHLYPADDAHSDFMQFQGLDSSNVTIRGNVFLAQNRFDTQGIFITGEGGNSNILIEDNIIYTKMTNAIYVADGSTGIVIRDNTVIAADGEVTRISAPEGARVTGNVQTLRNGRLDTNLALQGGDPEGEYYLGAHFPGFRLLQGLSLADLVPAPGSPAAAMGASRRLAELLGQ